MPKTELVILALAQSALRDMIGQTLQAAGFGVEVAANMARLEKLLRERTPSVVAVADVLQGASGLEIAASLLERFPTLPVVLIADLQASPTLLQRALRVGISDCLTPPWSAQDVTETIIRARKRADTMGDWVRKEVRRNTQTLEQRIHELETLVGLGRQITDSLDLDRVLTEVVSSAVRLTGAAGGALLLRLPDNPRGLTVRAASDTGSQSARTLDTVVDDPLAEQALANGEIIVRSQAEPLTILGDVQARSLIYIPLQTSQRAIGLLGVYQTQAQHPFREYDFLIMSVLSDYAAIAIENARLYQFSQVERRKLETTLNGISEGVIVLNASQEILFINQTACVTLGLDAAAVTGQSVLRFITHPDLLGLLNRAPDNPFIREQDVVFDNGRVFTARHLPVQDVGWALTMQDVTNLKMMDRIKSDFIHTVSHDLRSPLTAILGYVELLERIGPLNDQQREFVRRVQFSVHSITALVNDLLDLGRIEAGFDASRDEVSLQTVLHYTLDTFQNQAQEKRITLSVHVAAGLPVLRGNPIRLRQLMDNLVGNAIKYTPQGGSVWVTLRVEDGQVILQVTDSGAGIPLADQPHIFEKFFRASNVPRSTPGTGLGLAIVKSIVENHGGRIWVESTLGKGATFYVVLPVYEEANAS